MQMYYEALESLIDKSDASVLPFVLLRLRGLCVGTRSTVKVTGIRNSIRLSENTVPHNEHHIRYSDISDEEYSTAYTATSKLHEFIGRLQLIWVAELNYEDYLRTVQYYRELSFDQLQHMIRNRKIYIDINRVFLNLLVGLRMYLDHTETYIKRQYGEESSNWQKFRKACVDAYDGHFAYRFMYKLRNYAQHCGLPLNTFNVSEHENREVEGEAIRDVSYGILRGATLLDYEGWGVTLRKELQNQPDVIRVDMYVCEYVNLVKDISHVVSMDELNGLKPYAYYLYKLAERVGFGPDDMEFGIYELDVEHDENDKIIRLGTFRGQVVLLDVVHAALESDMKWILAIKQP